VNRELGIGLTYWPALESLFQRRADVIDVIEVSPETLWVEDGRGGYVCDQAELDRLAAFSAPKVIHGVTNPVGGSAPADQVRVGLVSAIIDLLGCDLASEHLSFTRVAGDDGDRFTGFMLPPRQSAEGVEVAAGAARAMAAQVGVQFAIENGVSYLRRRRDEMADGEFVASVAEQADVAILLDLHNAYANERNGRGSMAAFVDALPLERVTEIHLAGGRPYGHYWLDAHSGAIPDAVFGFARELAASLPNLRVVNFEFMPMYFAEFGADGIARELDRCHEVWAARRGVPARRPQAPGRPAVVLTRAAASPAPADWERELAALVREPAVEPAVEAAEPGGAPAGGELSADPGVNVLRFLIAEFRAGMLARGLKLATRLLLLYLGEPAVREIYADFFATRPPELFAGAEAEAFARYLAGRDLDVPHLRPVVSFELALQHAAARGESVTVEFDGDPEEILSSLARGLRPPPPGSPSQPVVVAAVTRS
jgi:uncharacterized protein (UPF0276 family)